MERTQENIVSSFFFYMWNMWSKEECEIIFSAPESKVNWEHIWSKWCHAYERMDGPWGAAEYMYGELDNSNRELLVKRACQMYDGMSRRKENE